MKTISDYTIYCTEAQTRKAIELGAPIEYASIKDIRLKRYVYIGTESYAFPTAEEMMGWLEEHFFNEVHVEQEVNSDWEYIIYDKYDTEIAESFEPVPSRKEATLAAIDAALEYLSNNKN